MGVTYFVFPIDQEFFDWLKSMDIEIPDNWETSRYPTPNEVFEIIKSFKNMKIDYNQEMSDLKITMRDPKNLHSLDHLMFRIRDFTGEDQALKVPHKIEFHGGAKEIFVDVLEKLSKYCGPLVLVDEDGKPVYVT